MINVVVALSCACIMLRGLHTVTIPMQVSHMKQCAEDMELKLQGNVQSVVYSGIKNIVKTTSGKTNNQLIVCVTGHFT